QKRFLRHRRVRELREGALAAGNSNLVWQDGEALCLTPEFQSTLKNQIPHWLSLDGLPQSPRRLETHAHVDTGEGHQGHLLRRREIRPFSCLWSWLSSRRPTSPELRQAGLLFRLQRYGIPGPRVLAFGQRLAFPWQVESFLLTEAAQQAVPLHRWLEAPRSARERRRVIHEAGKLLRLVHEAGCFFAHSGRDKD